MTKCEPAHGTLWEGDLIHDAHSECMRFELERLNTFTLWKNYEVYPTHLARAGFFSRGEGDKVECFQCKGHIIGWKKGDDVYEKHKAFFPHCLFIRGEDLKNVPLALPPILSYGVITQLLRDTFRRCKDSPPYIESKSDEEYMDFQEVYRYGRSSSTPLHAPISETQPDASVSTYSSIVQRSENSITRNGDSAVYSDNSAPSGAPLQCVTWNIQPRSESNSHRQGYVESGFAESAGLVDLSISQGDQSELNNTDSFLPIVTESILQEPSTSFLETFVDESLTATPDPRMMLNELNRLVTFQIWPKRTIIDSSLMAAAGFYHVGPGDKVRCAFCNGAMMNWAREDDPHSEHVRYFGDRCPFMKGEYTENIPIERRSEGSSSSSSWQSNTSNQRGLYSYQTLQLMQDASSPELAEENDRYVTFRGWPANKRQKPIELARAGFFFTGRDDQVRCFFCDVGLCNWVPSDDPWTEHARWFPRCGFLIQTKGESFIRQIQQRFETHGAENMSLHPAAVSTRRSLPSLSVNPDDFDRRLIPANMATPMVQRALSMGYSRDRVRDLVENRLRNTGEGYPSLTALVEDLLDVPDNQNQTRTRRESTSLTDERHTSGTTSNQSVPHTWPQNTPQRTEELPTWPGNTAQRTGDRPTSSENRAQRTETSSSASRGSDTTLAEEIEEMRRQRLCKICLDAEANVLLLKCGHLVACVDCGRRLTRCPVCRGVIRGSVKAYLS